MEWIVNNQFGIVSSIGGIIIGAFVTWLAARWYYVKAGNELKETADKLVDILAAQNSVNAIADYIVRALPSENVRLKFDDDGNPCSVVLFIRPEGLASTFKAGNTTFKRIEK